MNKTEVQTIIDKLANGKKEVLIGNALDKLQKTMPRYYSGEISVFEDTTCKLLGAWEDCGTTKSLQQIAEDSGFEVFNPSRADAQIILKDPNARRLFEFLKTIL